MNIASIFLTRGYDGGPLVYVYARFGEDVAGMNHIFTLDNGTSEKRTIIRTGSGDNFAILTPVIP
jgi:hypothetical protein